MHTVRIRNIPFGYQMRNGKVILHENEAPVVRQIFSRYLLGMTLRAIAGEMQIPYSEASPNWDQCKVKRMLDDRRYTGEQEYPPLVSATDFNTVQKIKMERRSLKTASTPDEIQSIRQRLFCQQCGSRFRRQSRPYGERWICSSRCGSKACLSRSDLIKRTIDSLDAIGSNPDIIGKPHVIQPPSLSVTRLQNEWQREMSKVHPDAEKARSILYQLTAEKYAEIDDAPQIALALRNVFAGYEPNGQLHTEVFERVVDKVLIDADGTVALRLKNGQILPQKE